MRIRLLLSTALALSPAMVGHTAAPASAEVPEPRGLNHPLRQTLREMDQVRADAEELFLYSRYCLPPDEPQKQPTRDALDALQARLQKLRVTAAQQKATFESLGKDEAGLSARGAYPPVGGVLPPSHDTQRDSLYWRQVKDASVPAQEMINSKRARLERAKEVDCSPTEEIKKDIVVQPPLPPPPPPPPPEPPKERLWDPMAGLAPPATTATDLPVFPQFFCSEAEKQAMLARIDPAKAKAQRDADAMEAYARTIEARKAQLASEGMPQHWQNSMDYAARNARFERDSHLSTIKSLDLIRRQIELTPVKDCSTKTPKDELKTGWDFKAGLEYGLGELKFPDAGYLGVEDTGTTERINGVIKAAGESGSARRSGVEINVPLNWTPWQIFPDFGAKSTETRLGASITRTSSNASRWGQFDPMGDTLFIPGLSDDIGDTFSLPFSGIGTIRDNFVDDFRYAGEFRRSEFGLKISEDFVFPGCNDFTLTKTFGLNQSWLDRRETVSAEVLDYFPIASPGFNVRADYHSVLDSSTTALKLGFDGAYAPKDWGGLYLSAGLSGWVGYTDTDGTAALQLHVDGGITEQGAEFSKSDTTFGYQLKGAIGVDFGFGKAELGVEYRNDGDTPVIDYGAGAAPRIRHEEREEFFGVLRTTFTF